jgi:uncharacterized delta-60 repeat protein
VDQEYVSSVLPLANGQLLVSGKMRFPDEIGAEYLARLNPDGSRDPSFPIDQFGGGKMTAWNEKLFLMGGQVVDRLLLAGMPDPTWTHMNTFPLFTSGQGGDYVVFPDGRLLFTGSHGVHDPTHGFNGQYSLVWFSNTGWLDTTRIHRQTDGAIYRIAQLDNGQFYCGGAFTQYEGNPAYALARVEADGAYDPAFQTDILWGQPWALHPLSDGRVWVGGDFTFPGTTDTLRLMRFMPDGSLDPVFNTSHTFYSSFSSNRLSMIINITELNANRFVVTGYFDRVDDAVHGGIAMFDSTGTLLEDYFQGASAGYWTYMNGTGATVVGIMPTGDGTDDYWIWGSYHGYDDGTTNDTTQRMVSRLHGLSVGVAEVAEPTNGPGISPNPSTGIFTLNNASTTNLITVYTSTGQQVWQGTGNTIDLTAQPPGVYTVVVATERGRQATRLVLVR